MSEGNGHLGILTFTRPPSRVVSLVPSMTESLYDLGFGGRLVGVTEYCRPPEADRGRLTVVGGTKSVDVDAVVRLKPDLVVANQEENTPQVVEVLEGKGIKVWVTFPRSVREAIQVLWALSRIFRAPEISPRIQTLEVTADWALQAASARKPTPYFCPVWKSERGANGPWWMTFNQDTYANDLLAHCGGLNVFTERERRYPLEADLGTAPPKEAPDRDRRYPRVTLEEISAAEPEIILLPNEPFAFSQEDRAEIDEALADTPAVRSGRVHLVDGSLITWHGTRLARALVTLPPLFDRDAS